jgi:hypothetical protein
MLKDDTNNCSDNQIKYDFCYIEETMVIKSQQKIVTHRLLSINKSPVNAKILASFWTQIPYQLRLVKVSYLHSPGGHRLYFMKYCLFKIPYRS